MIITKKMRDGSFIELNVDEDQGAFLLKHDPAKYSLDTKKNPKEFKVIKEESKIESIEIPDLEVEDVKEDEEY